MSSTLISDVNADRLDLAVVAEHEGGSRNLLWSPFIHESLVVIAPSGTPSLGGGFLVSVILVAQYTYSLFQVSRSILDLALIGPRR